METPYRAGFNRGSADKLAGRPYDKSAPSNSGDSKEYRRGYRRGYKETDRVGLSLEGSLSVSTSKQSKGSSTPSGGGGVSTPSDSRGGWLVSPVALWQEPSKSAREAMLVRALRQVGASGKPLLVSFFLRRVTDPTHKALGDDELLAYGIVQTVAGDGYDARTYVTKITSYARYTPSGPAEGAAPSDAPAIGSIYALRSNDLASMAEYNAPVGEGFQATLPETSPTTSTPPKPKWPDIIAALNDLDNKIAAIDAAIGTKDVTAWGPKYDAFVTPWRATAAKIRTARTMRNEYSDTLNAEAAIMSARAEFAKLYDEWNTLGPKPKVDLTDVQKKTDAKTPLTEEKKAPPAEDMPPVTSKDLVKTDKILDGGAVVRENEEREQRKRLLTASQPSWFEENWKYLAVGGLLLAGGGYLYMRQRSV